MRREEVLSVSLVELSLLTNSNKDIRTILEMARMTCIGNFMPEEIAIFFKDIESSGYRDEKDSLPPFPPNSPAVEACRAAEQPFAVAAAANADASSDDGDWPAFTRLVIPIRFQEELLGFLLLGEQPGDLPYGEADHAHLGQLASITGTAMQNAILINDLEAAVAERTAEAEAARKVAEQERAKSDRLLLNILPREIADEIKTRGVPRPRQFDSVTVIFTDFKGFTRVAEKMDPQELVTELDRCFSYFDNVIERHNLEKLKTIGDAYMCAGGIPVSNETHAVEAVLAAIEIIAFMDQMKKIRSEQGLPYWELRLGINTGPLVAGVIGEKKFAYDVWGDTVNTASRMESAGLPGRINISKSTRDLVAPYFELEDRGKIPAKNKGEIQMYLVEGIKDELRVPETGAPGEKFFEKLNAGKN